MKSRCLNPRCKPYPNYGGRGIKICERWMQFENFLADMGEKPHGLSIGRIDNDGNYEPSNCRWESSIEQNNNKRSLHLVTHLGKTMSLMAWARELGINYKTLHNRCNAYGDDVAIRMTYVPGKRRSADGKFTVLRP